MTQKNIVLSTAFNDVGHIDDDDLAPDTAAEIYSEENDVPKKNVVPKKNFTSYEPILPLSVFRVIKTVESVPEDIVNSYLDGQTYVEFPTTRLLEGFSKVLTKIIDPAALIDISKPDLVSILTASLLLNCNELKSACFEKINLDALRFKELPRLIKLIRRFPNDYLLVEAVVLFTLRNFSTDAVRKIFNEESFLDNFFNQKKQSFEIELFRPVTVTLQTTEFSHLEKHRFERKVIENGRFKGKHFLLIRQYDEKILCSARMNNTKNAFLLFEGYNPSSMQAYDQNYCGSVQANFLGDTWTVFDCGWGQNRLPQGQIIYDQNPLGRIPNAMKIVLSSTGNILHTKKPRWSDTFGWSLDFKKRVTIASKKNFLLLPMSNHEAMSTEKEIVMLFGKFKKHEFSLDICPPMNVIVAFAIALTTFADKLMVS